MKVKKTYSIGDLSEIVGISKRQLRNWEALGYIQEPMRIRYGKRHYRRYSNADLKLLKKIKFFIDQGFTLKSAVVKAKQKTWR
jgi:DNA-binding transcriptional MerR regulator